MVIVAQCGPITRAECIPVYERISTAREEHDILSVAQTLVDGWWRLLAVNCAVQCSAVQCSAMYRINDNEAPIVLVFSGQLPHTNNFMNFFLCGYFIICTFFIQ
jgi:hypothetical protein